jgi:protease-4
MDENRRSRTWLWIVIGEEPSSSSCWRCLPLVYLSLHAGGENASLRARSGDQIGVVELEGVILDPSMVVQQLKKFGEDDSIKAIILHVNSSGGGVSAS